MSATQRRSVIYAHNFLRDSRLAARLVRRSSIGPRDLVYEIGPGRGIITAQLARACRRVVAVEKDPQLACRLQRRFADAPNVTVVDGDFLKQPLPHVPHKVFGSIPFNITAAIVTKLARASRPPEDAYLVLQREAADRFTGRPVESLAAILLKPWFELQVLHRFQRDDFSPPPGVDVVLMRMRKRGPPLVATGDARLFRALVAYVFTAWQPTVGGALLELFGRRRLPQVLSATGVDPHVRPSLVSIEHWLTVFNCFKDLDDLTARRRVLDAEGRLRRQQARLQKSHRTRILAGRGRGGAPGHG